jgi:hypothetical protein
MEQLIAPALSAGRATWQRSQDVFMRSMGRNSSIEEI